MNLDFERGDRQKPKGHAFIYFTAIESESIYFATYLMVQPINVDVSKYVPPFLMNHVGELEKDLSAFAFPPSPEQIDHLDNVKHLAEIREDDLIYGGNMPSNDPTAAMIKVNEILEWYLNLYQNNNQQISNTSIEPEIGTDVDEVIYSLMNDQDKLEELTKLIGKLRYAADDTGSMLSQETEDQIKLLSQHLPENHEIPKIIQAAKGADSLGHKLANLYLQRSFHLINESFADLSKIENEIKKLEEIDQVN
ncbi:MAG: hypothetical protein CL880_03365 [Dehalococcoidia bacterium]|nr:hypothetical protein [Dehalococcoidia bacterium]|tara:strand:+ start:1105 stop:1857 length:753 start_codon:yes stop_codon:yes gene_type:complete